jgi:hypothetical protein
MGSSDSIQDSHYHHPALTMVNLKGQLGLSLEQIIKIILFAAMLLVVIYMAYSMLEIFLAAREEYSAKQTVELMSKRIDHMLAAKEQQAFMIVHLPGSQQKTPNLPLYKLAFKWRKRETLRCVTLVLPQLFQRRLLRSQIPVEGARAYAFSRI